MQKSKKRTFQSLPGTNSHNTRQFWYGALRSEARIHPGHAAVIFGHVWQLETAYRTVCHFVCPWPTFSPSPICYLLGHVWQIEMAHHTVCHLVCLWPASFPGTLRPLGVSAPRICRVFAQKKVGIFDRWDMIG